MFINYGDSLASGAQTLDDPSPPRGARRGPPTRAGLLATLAALVGLLVVLTGCAAVPRQALSPSAGASIKKIVVLRPPEPAEYTVRNFSRTAALFGLIGSLANAADQSSKASDVTALLKAQHFEPAGLLSRAIAEELKRRGYDATVAPLVVAHAAPGKSADDVLYSGLAADVDAVLVPAIDGVGYVSLPGEESYAPWVMGNAALFSTRSRSRLYFQVYTYGWDLKKENVEYLPAGQSYASFDSVTASAQRAAGGLEDGIASIATLIGGQLGGTPAARPAAPALAGAAGFLFGADADAAEKACVDAGVLWKAEAEDRFSCSGAPADVGFPVAPSVEVCHGKVCKIALDAAHDGSAWPELVARFVKLKGAFDSKYGSGRSEPTLALADCSDALQRCFEKGRIEMSASWTLKNGQTVELALNGGDPGGKPTLGIVYRTRTPSAGGP